MIQSAAIPNAFLAQHLGLIPQGGEILYLVETAGNAAFLIENGYRVTTVDSPLKLPFFDFGFSRWDGIVSIWTNLSRDARRPVHRSCVEGLKPGGVFLLEDFVPQLTKAELLEELCGLHVTHALELSRDIRERTENDGRRSVVQVLGKKPL